MWYDFLKEKLTRKYTLNWNELTFKIWRRLNFFGVAFSSLAQPFLKPLNIHDGWMYLSAAKTKEMESSLDTFNIVPPYNVEALGLGICGVCVNLSIREVKSHQIIVMIILKPFESENDIGTYELMWWWGGGCLIEIVFIGLLSSMMDECT